MVVRTEICQFCEYKIYPGRGIRYIAKDGRTFLYLNKKTLTFGLSKTKSHRIKWTTAWRRKNKKIKLTGAKKKRRRKGTKI